MNQKNISILVIDRSIDAFKGEEVTSLEEEIDALKQEGYELHVESDAEHLSASYDIIIAHPRHNQSRKLYEFHKANPKIPLIVHSLLYRAEYSESEKPLDNVPGYGQDSDGIYIVYISTTDDLLCLVKCIAEKITSKAVYLS